MKLFVNGQDISGLVEQMTWAGDTRQVARTLNFTLAHSATDRHVPKMAIDEGDTVRLVTAEGAVRFTGVVFEIDRTASGNTIGFFAYDLLFYAQANKLNMTFNTTPKKITEKVCKELGIPLKHAEDPKGKVKFNCFGRTGYEAIMIGYSQAHRKNGATDHYIPLMDGAELSVIRLGMDSGVVLDPNTNLIEATYKTSATKVVNRVLVTNKEGKKLTEVADAESRAKYGTLQQVLQAENKKAGTKEAKTMLTGIEQVASVTALHDHRAVAGWSLAMIEPSTGLAGKFIITSDSHTFANGQQTMELTLGFETLMDLMDLPKEGAQ